jgi:hypothetical protein
MRRIAAAVALAVLTSACGDASTAPSGNGEEMVVISLADVGADAAGVVLRLSGGVEAIEAAHPSLELAWTADAAHSATVALLGPIADINELLIVTRPAGAAALTVQVIDVTDGDGALSVPAAARVVVTGPT